ncbi:MAG: hypothetical protein HZC45_04610 [Deltaproteobacteria bacterium]|nr:hypothetical protein [Deltaproteobacteria bacterium]
MITIFTTTKPFIGQMKINQINAITSWKMLHPDIEVLIFGKGEGREGIEDVVKEFSLLHIPDVETSERDMPLISSMFDIAKRRGHYNIQMFINCDIILVDDFLPALRRITMDRFLMVGQRYNLTLDRPVNFKSPCWIDDLRKECKEKGEIMDVCGIDYFTYPKDIWKNLPPMAVGRPVYDNWLLYNCRRLGIPLIDVSNHVLAVHQNHDYSYYPGGKQGISTGAEVEQNRRLAGGKDNYFTIRDADWVLTDEGLKRNYCRGDILRYMDVYAILYPDKFGWFKKITYLMRMPREIASYLYGITFKPLVKRIKDGREKAGRVIQ